MTPQRLLPIPMFLLIFGPKSNGWMDVVSLTAFVLAAAHFLFLNTHHIPRQVKRQTALLGLVFTGLFLFAATHFMRCIDGNPYQTLRFGRITLNFLGVASLVSIYYRTCGDAAGRTIIRHLFHCLVFHALIMAVMFGSTSFRHLVVNQVVQANPDSRTYLAKASGYRIAGLTDSWDALSGLQSLGLLILPVLLTRQRSIAYTYAIVATPLLLFSVAISGRTGFVTLALLFPVALFFTDLRRVHRTTLVAAVVASFVFVLVAGPLQQSCLQMLEDTSLGRTLAMFGLEAAAPSHRSDHIWDTLTGILHDHYFLPESMYVLVFGSGGSGRDPWDYVRSDNGPVMNLHTLGIFCFAAIYGCLAWLLAKGLQVRRQSPLIAGASVLAVLLILLIDVKVMYVFSRNGFTVMFLPVMVACWELTRVQQPTFAQPRCQVATYGKTVPQYAHQVNT